MKLKILFICMFVISLAIQAEPIVLAHNMAEDATISASQDKPIVFFVTADHCPYCEQLRDEYFKFSPSDERFLLREIELDNYHELIGFKGEISNHQLIADRYGIFLTPTVAFVGPDGAELIKPLVGVLTMDFYHHYFEKALGEAINALKVKNAMQLGSN